MWHGLYPGYLIFFASSAGWLWTSTVIYKAEQTWPAGEWGGEVGEEGDMEGRRRG